MPSLPTLNGNWVDLIITIAALFYIRDGIRRGFILTFLDLISFILSFFAAVKFYAAAAWLISANFNLPRGIANAAGFLLAGFVAEVFFALLARQILGIIPKQWTGGKMEKALGIIPAIGNTVILTAFLLTLMVTMPVQGVIKSAIVTSKLGGPLVTQTAWIEKQLNQIFGAAIEESLTFFTIQPNSSASVELNFKQRQLTVDTQAEHQLFQLVNKERAERGLPQLVFTTGALQKIARSHARDMFQRGYFSHYTPEGKSPFERMNAAGITYTAAGENLALAPTVQLAHQGLMNSAGHRANILSADFNKIGIGVIDGGIYGKMFVQEFTD